MFITEEQKQLLLDDLTQKEFGYSVLDLSRGSTKCVWHRCVVCDRPKKNMFRRFVISVGLSHSQCKEQLTKQTWEQKYKVDHPFKNRNIQQKRKQTWEQKYGVDNPQKSKRVREKTKQTCLERYVVKYVTQSEQIQKKIKQTNIKKYGVVRLGNLKHEIKTKQYWLRQEFYDGCKINPDQDLPDRWSQGTSQKLEIVCSCGKIFVAVFNDFILGRHKGCGHYRQSRGEKQLGQYLEQLFPGQVTAQDNLGFLKRQTVDYAVRDLKLAFEYDGEHHFRPVRFNGKSLQKAEKQFKKQKINDKKKDRLLEQYGWTLIRIKYDQDIEQQLISKLRK